MNEILLINSCGLKPGKAKVGKVFLPYGLGIIKQYLKNNGLKTKAIDLGVKLKYYHEQIGDEAFNDWIENDNKSAKIDTYLKSCFELLTLSNDIKIIGISVTFEFNYKFALSLSKFIKIKYPDIKICLGGAYITDVEDEFTFPKFIDYLIKGSGGPPFLSLCKHLLNNDKLNTTGIWLQKDNSHINNGKYYIEAATDEVIPDYTDFNIEDYVLERPSKKLVPIDFDKYVVFPYRTHKGCTNNCTFCSLYRHKPMTKSADKAFNDIMEFTKLYSNCYIQFCDAAINSFPSIFDELLDKLIESKVKINFFGFAKINNMTIELVEKLHKAGCREIVWGFEHFSQKIVDYYNKRFDVTKVESIVKRCSELGIFSRIYLMANAPVETENDFALLKRQVLRLLKFRYVEFEINSFGLAKNSPIDKAPEKFGIKKIDLSKTYPPLVKNMGYYIKGMPVEQFVKHWKKRNRKRKKLQQIVITNSALRMRNIYLPILFVTALTPMLNRIKSVIK